MEKSVIWRQDVADWLERALQRPLRCISLNDSTINFQEPPAGFDIVLVCIEDFLKIISISQKLAEKNQICLIQSSHQNSADRLFNVFTYIEKISPNIYFCSNTYWYAKGEIAAFNDYQHPFNHVPGGSSTLRRYYFSENHFLKRYQGNIDKGCKEECKNEIDFLTHHQHIFPSISLPKLCQYHIEETEMWILREKVSGTILMDIIQQKQFYHPEKIIGEVLAQLVKLESCGLYQTDLRTWNVMMTASGHAQLIDYGSIKNTLKDTSPGRHVYFSFWVFCYEVITGQVTRYKTLNPAVLNEKNYPEKYRHWLRNILAVPFKDWNFKLFSQYFYSIESENTQYADSFIFLSHWLSRVELRFSHFNQFPLLPPRFRNWIRAKEMLQINFHTLKLRYFERRFFKYFEKNFINKQQQIFPETPLPHLISIFDHR
jgi:hypothetical protein